MTLGERTAEGAGAARAALVERAARDLHAEGFGLEEIVLRTRLVAERGATTIAREWQDGAAFPEEFAGAERVELELVAARVLHEPGGRHLHRAGGAGMKVLMTECLSSAP